MNNRKYKFFCWFSWREVTLDDTELAVTGRSFSTMNSLGEAILLVSRGNRHVNVFSDTNTVPGLGTLYDLDSYHDLAYRS